GRIVGPVEDPVGRGQRRCRGERPGRRGRVVHTADHDDSDHDEGREGQYGRAECGHPGSTRHVVLLCRRPTRGAAEAGHQTTGRTPARIPLITTTYVAADAEPVASSVAHGGWRTSW